jgi:hypothetical protein
MKIKIADLIKASPTGGPAASDSGVGFCLPKQEIYRHYIRF